MDYELIMFKCYHPCNYLTAKLFTTFQQFIGVIITLVTHFWSNGLSRKSDQARLPSIGFTHIVFRAHQAHVVCPGGVEQHPRVIGSVTTG